MCRIFAHFACAPLFGLLLTHKVQVLILRLRAGPRKALARLLLRCRILIPAVAPGFRLATTVLGLLAMLGGKGLLLRIKAVKSVDGRVDLEVLHIPLLRTF